MFTNYCQVRLSSTRHGVGVGHMKVGAVDSQMAETSFLFFFFSSLHPCFLCAYSIQGCSWPSCQVVPQASPGVTINDFPPSLPENSTPNTEEDTVFLVLRALSWKYQLK